MSVEKPAAPVAIRLLAVTLFFFSLLAFTGSLFLWGQGFLLSFPPGVDYSFPVTDILVNAPASMIAAVGLWRMRRLGYVAAQFVAGFYIYASVEIFVDVIQSGPPYPVEIVVPQVMAVVVAAALVLSLWPRQDLFR
jgi:hypothetical protein